VRGHVGTLRVMSDTHLIYFKQMIAFHRVAQTSQGSDEMYTIQLNVAWPLELTLVIIKC